MHVVLVLEQCRELVLVAGRNERWDWKFLFEILDNVLALDVHGTVVHQHCYQSADSPEVDLEGSLTSHKAHSTNPRASAYVHFPLLVGPGAAAANFSRVPNRKSTLLIRSPSAHEKTDRFLVGGR